MARIDHAAIRTKSYEEAQHFFEDVFEMHKWREMAKNREENAGTKKVSSSVK